MDHTVFLIGGNVTHLRKKAHIKVSAGMFAAKRCTCSCARLHDDMRSGLIQMGTGLVQAFKKRDGKSLVMFTHAKACKECTFAKPMFGKLAASGMEVTPDVEFAALDCTCVRATHHHLPAVQAARPPERIVAQFKQCGGEHGCSRHARSSSSEPL